MDPQEPSSSFLSRYFGGYEAELGLAVQRPVKVRTVTREDSESGRPAAGSHVRRRLVGARRDQRHRYLDPAVLADLSGPSSFRGRQLHVADYVSAAEFRGKHVIVVGGGISAVGLLDEISKVTATSWFTRREPVWRDAAFDRQAGHDAVALVEERVRQGLPPQSVVSVTGLIWTPALRAAEERGVPGPAADVHRPSSPDGVRLADGSLLAART